MRDKGEKPSDMIEILKFLFFEVKPSFGNDQEHVFKLLLSSKNKTGRCPIELLSLDCKRNDGSPSQLRSAIS